MIVIFDRLVLRDFLFFGFELSSEYSGGFFVLLHQIREEFGGAPGAPALHASVYCALLNTQPGLSGPHT